MGKYLVLWKLDESKIPPDPKEAPHEQFPGL